MPDDFDQVDQELVSAIAALQQLVLDLGERVNVAGFAAVGLAHRADVRGDVHRVAGLERAADRMQKAAGLVTSAAATLRMVEQPDEWPAGEPVAAPRQTGKGTELRGAPGAADGLNS